MPGKACLGALGEGFPFVRAVEWSVCLPRDLGREERRADDNTKTKEEENR